MGYASISNCYIFDIEAEKLYTFQFMPDSISDSKGSNWNEYAILGRSSPLRGYHNGPSREISFTVTMFADPTADGLQKSIGDIKQDVDFLLSLPYPDYSKGIAPPHRCLVNIGDIVPCFTAVCKDAKAEYRGNWPWESGPGLPHGVLVSLVFLEVQDTPLDTMDRRGGMQ
jgi:hypothetical protein